MQTEQMNWKNLRKNKCPKCSADLSIHMSSLRLHCANSACGYTISEERFKAIVGGMNKQALERPEYSQNDGVEDLQKSACNFCHQMHSPQEKCAGFGE